MHGICVHPPRAAAGGRTREVPDPKVQANAHLPICGLPRWPGGGCRHASGSGVALQHAVDEAEAEGRLAEHDGQRGGIGRGRRLFAPADAHARERPGRGGRGEGVVQRVAGGVGEQQALQVGQVPKRQVRRVVRGGVGGVEASWPSGDEPLHRLGVERAVGQAQAGVAEPAGRGERGSGIERRRVAGQVGPVAAVGLREEDGVIVAGLHRSHPRVTGGEEVGEESPEAGIVRGRRHGGNVAAQPPSKRRSSTRISTPAAGGVKVGCSHPFG